MADKDALFKFLCRMGDNCLIIGHRNSEWCGHAPILEEDIALANIALDFIGQTQLWLGLAGEVEGEGRTADNLAYLRDAFDFKNFLLVEQPNGDFAQTLTRQMLFDAWHLPMLQALKESSDERIAAIAEKAVKEAKYHLERSRNLCLHMGDGTEESKRRMQDAIDLLWPYTGEMFKSDNVDEAMVAAGVAPDLADIKATWDNFMDEFFAEAELVKPENAWFQQGGKTGTHTEHMGFLLADMQFLQRAYPGATW
ncbi:1,2-phenylacetyl-CoA epoxidase subunit PaaC [Curvivirga aplysinae]|uniref:1,2-phenylacetyl-CoA epoxidase subunit PaaC n=1 Tax=Curvivirga aplysinae TaxID=2529852 RepID=UPI0012BD4671|nr:1,2-phenylacetyl-CoA epoxidase subunit PaaC [Curvivirga aplysinae]MTI09870.1 phenylacetate-CoA oxygenase subunit PaaI [Curvivirga aplysinae]